MPRGRPKLYLTDEERHAAILRTKLKTREKTKNMTVDADLIAILQGIGERLEEEWGFRPTHSQVIRHLVNKEWKK